MKLRNKKTGEIIEFAGAEIHNGRAFLKLKDERGIFKREINFLSELNEEWEDYEEPKNNYFNLEPVLFDNRYVAFIIIDEESNRKEAKKVLEKLKAWKRLKDKGFEFFNNKIIGEYGNVSYKLTYPATAVEEKDLDLLFGGQA